MPESTPKYSTPLAGDIILCGASWNVHAQRVLRPGNAAEYSHAAVMCSINFGVQAMPDSGVDAFGLHEFLSGQVAGSPWKVFRHKDLDVSAARGDDMGITMRFRNAAKYFMGQRYNYGINLPELPGSTDSSQRSFCSQLVARIYEKTGDVMPHARLLTSTVLPADLQSQLTGNDDWLDVTSIYARRLDWVLEKQRLSDEIARETASIHILRQDLELSLWSQKKFAVDEAELNKIENGLSSLEAKIGRQYKAVTGNALPSMPPLDMTSHLRQALKSGSQSNWQTLKIFRGHQWRLRLRKIGLLLKGARDQK